MQLRMIGNHIAVQPIPHKTEYASGIVIPDDYQDNECVCKVLAVGPGKYDKHGNRIPIPFTAGDYIVLKDNVPVDHVSVGDITFIICTEEEVLLQMDTDEALELQNSNKRYQVEVMSGKEGYR